MEGKYSAAKTGCKPFLVVTQSTIMNLKIAAYVSL